ncbi:MAG: UDP-3-O-[3-hydroxymyristoyl] N-acetylglucosamine deacetylase [bacterium]|nr:UDP-3-O-[3-hydroxymyristoyl] N-acetylglucosamine deacetylase [bacterium]
MSELVLIVDDEPGILTALSGVLSDEGFDTLCTESGEEALELYRDRKPDVVFLDIWLPDRDGLETLQALRESDPTAAVIMMSGHGTTSTAVKALKMGAFDYVEKPLSYSQAVDSVQGAIAYRRNVSVSGPLLASAVRSEDRLAADFEFKPPEVPLLRASEIPQRTIAQSTVLYGLGLHSGFRTGMVIQPLPPNSGIHFLTLPTNTHVPGFVGVVAETSYATTLETEGVGIKTVEHFLSACHAYGVTNALVKVHGELPVLDGSAIEFCKTLAEVGVVDQDEPRKEIVIDREYRVSGSGEQSLTLEPADEFGVSYLLDYPPPVGRQSYQYGPLKPASYVGEIAPARTFGFVKDLDMMNELGLGTGGRLDNCILVGEDDIINTDLRFPDEFVRHKILDVIGDLYLLGYPMRGKVTASLTGHRDNIAILRKILEDNA